MQGCEPPGEYFVSNSPIKVNGDMLQLHTIENS